MLFRNAGLLPLDRSPGPAGHAGGLVEPSQPPGGFPAGSILQDPPNSAEPDFLGACRWQVGQVVGLKWGKIHPIHP